MPYRQSSPPTDLGQADSQTEAFVYAELRCDRTALVSAILRAGWKTRIKIATLGNLQPTAVRPSTDAETSLHNSEEAVADAKLVYRCLGFCLQAKERLHRSMRSSIYGQSRTRLPSSSYDICKVIPRCRFVTALLDQLFTAQISEQVLEYWLQ